MDCTQYLKIGTCALCCTLGEEWHTKGQHTQLGQILSCFDLSFVTWIWELKAKLFWHDCHHNFGQAKLFCDTLVNSHGQNDLFWALKPSKNPPGEAKLPLAHKSPRPLKLRS